MTRALIPIFCLALLAACQTTGPTETQTDDIFVKGQWPIYAFESYKVPAPDKGEDIKGYMDFGLGDGLLRFTLGCGVAAIPYTFGLDNRLYIEKDVTASEPSRANLGCSPELIESEERLAKFVNSKPKLLGFDDDGIVRWRANGKTLKLASQADIISGDDT